ncbi:MAG: methyl-accepting chemotaxis protein [bacterium]|nr:methyl-accepting chemotaxis protein [bacterium]
MKTLRAKLMTLFGILIGTICLGLGAVSIIAGVYAIADTVNRDIAIIAEQTAHSVKLELRAQMEKLEQRATYVKVESYKKDPSQMLLRMQEDAKQLEALKIAICDVQGNATFSNGTTVNIRDKEYFKSAMAGESYISDPQTSDADDTVVIVYAVPVTHKGQVVGVFLEERNGEEFSTFVNTNVFGRTGEGFMVNEKGTFVASKDKDLYLKAYNPKEDGKETSLIKVIDKMLKKQSGFGRYVYQEEKRNIGYMPVEDTRWSVGITISHNEIYYPLVTLMLRLCIAIAVFLVLSAIIVVGLARKLSDKIMMAANQLVKVSEGDLTGEVDEIILMQKDEVGQMANALKVMQEYIIAIVDSMKENSNALSDNSNELSGDAEEISKLSSSITEAIHEIAEGTSLQSNDLVVMTNILEQFNEKLEDMVAQIEDVDHVSRKIDQMAIKSSNDMNELNESVGNIKNTFVTFEKGMNSLGTNIVEINNITKMITDVTNQTNLLALNASIEAARAGEAGKGFSVVAQEIGSLAEQSRDSLEKINSLVKDISNNTDVIMKDAKGMGYELNDQMETIDRSIVAFKEIMVEIEEVIPKIYKVKEAGNEINKDKDMILSKIDEVSSVSEEISASSEEIAASTNEMNTSISHVTASAKELTGMTEVILGQVNKFRID